MLVIIAVVALVVVLAIIFSQKKRPANAPPNAAVGIPFLGNYLEFASNPVAFVRKCLNKFGPVYTVPMMGKNLTFLLGPEASAPFFKLPDEYMSQAEVYSFMTPVFGKGIVYDAEPKRRSQQYQTMASGLRANRLKSYVAKIEMETLQYLKTWGDSGTVNILDALSELTILTSSRCLHGDDVRENMFADVARIYHDLDKGITPLSFFFPNAPIAAHAKRAKAREEMVAIFSKIIAARRADGADNSQRTDILQLFIDFTYKEDGSILTNDEIVGLLIALLFAGQHTSSITSTWTTLLLLHNQRCLKEVMEEQKKILGTDDYLQASVDFDTIGNMEYLQNCIKEALRMYPPLILLMRMAAQDVTTTYEGKTYTIPKGDIVLASPAVAGRMGSVFKNPDDFEPERFGAERNEQKTPFAYLGFGGGMHACMGQQFGLLQVKTIVSILFRNFKMECVDKEMAEPDFTAMVVGPKNHLMVKYTKIPGGLV
jgi:sterol 14-demethylase